MRKSHDLSASINTLLVVALSSSLGDIGRGGKKAATGRSLRRRQLLAAHLFTLLFLIVWYLAAKALPPYVLAGPIKVALKLYEVFTTPSLLWHAWSSLFHVGSAMVISFVVGFALCTAAYYIPSLRFAVTHRITPSFNAFPGIGWIMLGIVWFGISQQTVIFAISVTLLPFILINLWAGFRAIESEGLEMAHSFTRHSWRKFVHVIVPGLFPFMFAAIRIAFGVSWKIDLTAELFAGRAGLGYLFNRAQQVYDVALIIVVIVIIIAFVYVTDRWIFQPVQRYLDRSHAM
jgi:NitT/TauT family transport system permease protein/sulfonate transport system permease protein